MQTTLIHCTHIGGHQLEYLHHLYIGALKNTSRRYVFAVPEKFKKDSLNYNWPQCDRITIDFISQESVNLISGGLIRKSYYKCKSLSHYIKKYKADRVILIDLISYLPMIPLLVSTRVKISGIIYRIYLYEWKDESTIKKLQDVFKYLLFSKCRIFDNIFILNDAASAKLLNKLYKSSKFKYLPDPVASVATQTDQNIRDEYGIGSDKTIILHPGGMLPYKGSIEILKAIQMLNKDICEKYVFIFAGLITPSIRNEFFELKNQLSEKARIILEEGFLPFERLGILFQSSDLVLIPYKVKCQSSGIVGHAAYYSKPVVVAKGGVIGKTVRKYNLGYLLQSPDAFRICKFLEQHNKYEHISGISYLDDHSVNSFNHHIGI